MHRSSNVFGCLVHVTKQNAKLNQETAHSYVWSAKPQKSRRFVQNVSVLPYHATVFVNLIHEGVILPLSQLLMKRASISALEKTPSASE